MTLKVKSTILKANMIVSVDMMLKVNMMLKVSEDNYGCIKKCKS